MTKLKRSISPAEAKIVFCRLSSILCPSPHQTSQPPIVNPTPSLSNPVTVRTAPRMNPDVNLGIKLTIGLRAPCVSIVSGYLRFESRTW